MMLINGRDTWKVYGGNERGEVDRWRMGDETLKFVSHSGPLKRLW